MEEKRRFPGGKRLLCVFIVVPLCFSTRAKSKLFSFCLSIPSCFSTRAKANFPRFSPVFLCAARRGPEQTFPVFPLFSFVLLDEAQRDQGRGQTLALKRQSSALIPPLRSLWTPYYPSLTFRFRFRPYETNGAPGRGFCYKQSRKSIGTVDLAWLRLSYWHSGEKSFWLRPFHTESANTPINSP